MSEKNLVTMSIHRGLTELGLLEKKINSAIGSFKPVGSKKESGKVDNFYTDDEFKQNVESTYQSINDMIERKIAIKSAINIANSNTTVVVGDKEMTITEAINYKTIINLKSDLYHKMINTDTSVKSTIDRANTKLDNDALSLYEKSATPSDNGKFDPEASKMFIETYTKTNKLELVDPIGCKDKYTKLLTEIQEFEAEVDTVLSEVNATTFIEV